MSTLKVNRIEPRTGDTVEIVGLDIPEPPEPTESPVKAWARFRGTGTVATYGSKNVSSITDNGVGTYTVNFTNAIEDTDYSAPTSLGAVSGRWDVHTSSFKTTSVRCVVYASAETTDSDNISLVILR